MKKKALSAHQGAFEPFGSFNTRRCCQILHGVGSFSTGCCQNLHGGGSPLDTSSLLLLLGGGHPSPDFFHVVVFFLTVVFT